MQRPKNEPPAKLIGWEDVPSLRMDLDWKELVRVAYELAKESGYLPSRGAQNDKLLFARSLFRDALTAVKELTPAVKSTPENFAWIFAKEREWPILWTDFLDHRQSNDALLETLRGQPAITPKASKQLESAAKLFARAHSAVTKLNAAAQADPDTYSKIAAKAPIGWPVLWAWSDDPTDPETSPRLIQDLAELERGPFKVFKGGRKALRLDMTKPMNKAAGRLAGILLNLQGVSWRLTFDAPTDAVYKNRCDQVFDRWEHKTPGAKYVLLAKLRQCSEKYLTANELAGFAWDILNTETNNHPERIWDLRQQVMSKSLLRRVDIARFEWRLEESLGRFPTTDQCLKFISANVCPEFEKTIQKRIRESLRQHLNWWNY